jgi:hypothetical protein
MFLVNFKWKKEVHVFLILDAFFTFLCE